MEILMEKRQYSHILMIKATIKADKAYKCICHFVIESIYKKKLFNVS